MTGITQNDLEIILERRPFASIAKVKRVSAAKKSGARKAPKVGIGEAVVDAVQEFISAGVGYAAGRP